MRANSRVAPRREFTKVHTGVIATGNFTYRGIPGLWPRAPLMHWVGNRSGQNEKGIRMDLRDFSHITADTSQSFTVTLTLSVEDVRALWSAAAEKALQAPGMTLSDVLDTLGPREDASIADCIAMLAAPAAIAGCALDDFSVRAVPAATAPGAVIPLPVEARPLVLMPAANG